MQTVVLVTEPTITFQGLFLMIQDRWPKVYRIDDGRLGLQDGDCHLFIDKDDYALDEYEHEELEKVKKLIANPNFYAIQYSLTHTKGGELVRRFLMTVVDDSRIVVDNTAGLIVRGPAFVRRLKVDPSWDWFNAGESTEEMLR